MTTLKLGLVQTTVGDNVADNLATIINYVAEATTRSILIFPEGMLSGYEPSQEDYLQRLSQQEIENGITAIQQAAHKRDLDVIFGTAYQEGRKWFNTAVWVNSTGQTIYRKVNLANLDRLHFEFGDDLPVFKYHDLSFGFQMCREINFPEQWQYLTVSGAKLIFHLNNNQSGYDSWVRVIQTRAYENGIYLVSVNVSHAEPEQLLFSYIISPNGEILLETKDEGLYEFELQMTFPEKHFSQQRRTDLFPISPLREK